MIKTPSTWPREKSAFDSKGFSLLELCIAVGICAAIALGGAAVIVRQFQFTRLEAYAAARDGIARHLKASIKSTAAQLVYVPYNANTGFQDCILAAGGPTPCQNVTARPIQIFDGSNPTPTRLSGGDLATAVYYNQSGTVCTLGSPGCFWQVITTYDAICPTANPASPPPVATPPCRGSAYLNVNYSIDLLPAAQRDGISSLRPARGSVRVSDMTGAPNLGPAGAVGYIPIWKDASGYFGSSGISQDLQTGDLMFSGNVTVSSTVDIAGDVWLAPDKNIWQQSTPTNQNYLTTANMIVGSASGDGPIVTGGAVAFGPLISTAGFSARQFLTFSDRRLKTAIQPLENVIERLQKLNGVSFRWKKSGRLDLGFIAQDVEKVFPELVITDKKGIKGIKYANLVAVIIEAERLNSLEFSAALQRQNDELAALQKRLGQLMAKKATTLQRGEK